MRLITRAALSVAFLFAVLVLLAGGPSPAADPASTGLPGFWLSENKDGTIEIYRTPAGLYEGKIVAGSGPPRRDTRNPDPALRERGLIGVVIMKDMKQDGPNSWSGGTIYDPDTGNTYRCRLKLSGDTLHLRGYVGISLFGRTSAWTRTAPPPAAAAGDPAKR